MKYFILFLLMLLCGVIYLNSQYEEKIERFDLRPKADPRMIIEPVKPQPIEDDRNSKVEEEVKEYV